ncbi:hypothetical protein [Rhizobium leguminosarum]|uniref:hypothetical protein n=1 Tax=Rhizobium leguminosarum TaxID=384 RepID=UPI002E13462C|nr:hypothetical protein U8Q02_39750 [Rhizobium leguminosarum]
MPKHPESRQAVVKLVMKHAGETSLSWAIQCLNSLLAGSNAPHGGEEILKSMVDHGRFVLIDEGHRNSRHYPSERYCILFSPLKKKGGSSEDKDENFEAVIKAVGDRTCETDGGRALMSYLFRLYRYLYGALKIETELGRAVLVAGKIGMDAAVGPMVVEGRLFVAQAEGVVCYLAPAGSITTRWERWKPLISVNVALLARDEAGTTGLAAIRMAPTIDYVDCAATNRANDGLRDAYRSKEFMPHRAAASVYVEEEITLDRWRGAAMTLSKVKRVEKSIRLALVSLLEPDVRRAALRDPFATYSFYNWFAAGGGETRIRRLQASESFPIASPILPKLEHVIDEGGSLIGALMDFTGMSKSQVKGLRSVHWQTVGAKNYRAPLFMGGVPPERVPKSKKDWPVISEMATVEAGGRDWVWHLPVDVRRAYMKAASSDWKGYRSLVKAGDFIHALTDMTGSLAPLATGLLTARKEFHPSLFALLVHLVGGESFGLKRLRRFGETWHAGTARRVSIERTIMRKAFGERLASWKPLTEDFQHEAGAMNWLVNEDDLAAEGQVMRHCVGSYVSRCVTGQSHIASFCGADGSRSTAEFYLHNGKVKPMQHKTYRNAQPSGDVVTIYDAFLKKVARKKFEIVRGIDGTEIEKGLTAPAPEEVLAALRLTWADCLPDECQSWTTERWRAEAARFAVPGADFPMEFEQEAAGVAEEPRQVDMERAIPAAGRADAVNIDEFEFGDLWGIDPFQDEEEFGRAAA